MVSLGKPRVVSRRFVLGTWLPASRFAWGAGTPLAEISGQNNLCRQEGQARLNGEPAGTEEINREGFPRNRWGVNRRIL